jgi:thiamine pyrophosphokinase
MNNCLIVCNGELSKRLLDRFLNLKKLHPEFKIMSCDGASDFLYRFKVTPDYIIGDMDGISKKALNYFRKKKVVVKKIVNQNQNDLEKALRFALSKKIKNISIIGFAGKRLDHTLNNLSVIKKFSRKSRITMYDKDFEIRFAGKSEVLNTKKGEIISLIPLPVAKNVITSGLKYTLKNEKLEFGIRTGALNTASDNLVKINVREGNLLVLRKHSGRIS